MAGGDLSSPIRRTIEDGELIFRDRKTKAVLWRGQPAGQRARLHVPAACSDDCFVLLDQNEFRGRTGNIVRVRPNGEVVWTAKRVQRDLYSDLSWSREEGLTANSMAAYHVVLDPATGDIVSKEFTK